MKKFLVITFSCFAAMAGAQTITFNGCHALFEDQSYVFNQTGSDISGRNIYKTAPPLGDQHCGGVGTCEFRLAWNSTSSRWEFSADRGDGDFVNSFLIYTNTSPSMPNPPDLTLGSWVENTSTTTSLCGGDLSAGNATLTGSVQSTVLHSEQFSTNDKLLIYPNPAKGELKIYSSMNIEKIVIYNELGQEVLRSGSADHIDVSGFDTGVYFLRVESGERFKISKFVKN